MSQVGIQELLEAGVHFGHQTSRWNPNMRRYIAGELDGIHIIDLMQTEQMLEDARRFVGELTSGGGKVLFVGTKKQASTVVEDWAARSGMPFVSRRWLPGLLTNFNIASARIKRLHELTEMTESGQIELLPTKERMNMQAELAKLEFALGGVRDMDRVPDAVFIIDLKAEEIALREATRLRLPVIALVDSNCDPGNLDYVIPGNDDAIRSCELVISTIGSAVEQGAGAWAVIEEKRRAEEQARREKEEEERKKREEEERVRREAIEKEQAEQKARQRAEEAARAEAEKGKPAARPPEPAQPARDEAAKPTPDKAEPHPQAVPDHPQAVVPDHPQAVVPDHPQAVAAEPEPDQAEATEAPGETEEKEKPATEEEQPDESSKESEGE
ncbi:MAG: 30S ribosomal protein S2 [Solirubrobacterales bacterium]|nr:30S ribosomal protein S2 [Solirubrobacterales bacterium]